MKKSLIALLLVVALVVTVSVFAASAAEPTQLRSDLTIAADGATATGYCPHCNKSVTWNKAVWGSGHSSPAAGHWFMAESYTGNGAIQTPAGDYVLHLNGKTYTRDGGTSNTTGCVFLNNKCNMAIVDSTAGTGGFIAKSGGRVINVATQGTLNVYSGDLTSDTSTTKTQTNGGIMYVNSGATINLYDTTLSGGYASAEGGALYYTGVEAKVTMKNGSVIENCASNNKNDNQKGGGAVKMTGSGNVFTMEPGSIIRNCTAVSHGGAVNVQAGTFNMNGGTIKDCSAKSKGGAVYLSGKNSKILMSGGTIENCSAESTGGAVLIQYQSQGSVISGTALIQNCSAPSGGAVHINGSGNPTLTMTGGTIQKNTATANGGGIHILNDNGESGTFTMEGGSVINNKANQGGNIKNQRGTVNLTGGTVSGGSANVGPDIRFLGSSTYAGTVNLTNVTMIGAGVHGYSISLGDYANATLAGNTYLDRVQVESSALTDETGTRNAYAKILVKEGYTGTAYVGWSDVPTTAAIAAGATTHESLWQEAGYTGTGSIFALDSTTSGKILADTGDATGTDNKFVVAGFAGVKVDADGELTLTPIGGLEEAAGYDFVRPYFNNPITLVDDLTLDLNNATLHVITGEHKLNLIEMRTDTFADAGDAKEGYIRGYVTVDNAANLNTIVREQATGNQYIVVPTGKTEEGLTKFTAHRVQVDIDSVNIKPATAGLYYTTNMDTTPTASQFAMSYGVVLSLVDMPGADFLKDDSNTDEIPDNMYTEIDFEEDIERVAIKGANSALLVGILNQGAPEGQNNAWGTKPIFANAYVCFNIDGKDYYVMADKTYELSLKDIMVLVDKLDPTNAGVQKMYDTWQDPLAQWGLTNIEAAYNAAKA